jgi:hypothetical protein
MRPASAPFPLNNTGSYQPQPFLSLNEASPYVSPLTLYLAISSNIRYEGGKVLHDRIGLHRESIHGKKNFLNPLQKVTPLAATIKKTRELMPFIKLTLLFL